MPDYAYTFKKTENGLGNKGYQVLKGSQSMGFVWKTTGIDLSEFWVNDRCNGYVYESRKLAAKALEEEVE